MKVKVWDVLEGPIAVSDLDEEAPEGANYVMVCRAEIDGVMADDNFWFEDVDDAYEWESHFKKSIEPLVIDMDSYDAYN